MSDRTDWGPTKGESKITFCSIVYFINAGLWVFLPNMNYYFICLCMLIMGAGFVMRGDDND